MDKKAIVGIGTLIIFIAGILVAAIGAGVIVTTQNKIRETALATGRDAESSVTSAIYVQKVNVVDNKFGSNNKYGFNTIEMKVRLAEGGEPVNLNKTTIEFASPNGAGSMNYGGTEYFTTKKRRMLDFEVNSTLQKFKTDLDDDLKEDEIYVLDPNTIRMQLSLGDTIDITVPSLSVVGNIIDVTAPIIYNGYDVGDLVINTTIVKAGVLAPNSIDVQINDYGFGKYSAVHLLTTKKTLPGALQHGEILSIKFETPVEVGSTEVINLLFYTQRGIPELTMMYTPEVMVDKQFTLFPK